MNSIKYFSGLITMKYFKTVKNIIYIMGAYAHYIHHNVSVVMTMLFQSLYSIIHSDNN